MYILLFIINYRHKNNFSILLIMQKVIFCVSMYLNVCISYIFQINLHFFVRDSSVCASPIIHKTCTCGTAEKVYIVPEIKRPACSHPTVSSVFAHHCRLATVNFLCIRDRELLCRHLMQIASRWAWDVGSTHKIVRKWCGYLWKSWRGSWTVV